MRDLKINIDFSNKYALVSYTHPWRGVRKRKILKNKDEAYKYKKWIQEKYPLNLDQKTSLLSIEDLWLIFMSETSSRFLLQKSSSSVDFLEVFGDFFPNEVTKEMIDLWLEQLQKEKNLSDGTVAYFRDKIGPFFNDLVQKKIIKTSPVARSQARNRPVPINPEILLNEQQLEVLLRDLKLNSPGYLYPIVKMVLETGMKSYEICNLSWSDLDFENKKIKIKKSGLLKGRTLEISEDLIEILKLKDWDTGRIFMTYNKKDFTRNRLNRAISEFKLKSTFKKEWSLAELRHAFAINFLKQGGNLQDLKRRLGCEKMQGVQALYSDILKKQALQKNISPFG